ncbi:hypothetical protein L7F22_053004 [Adiantum nelumboides]|nr:hypothetical protein [Adiantum nelumboides]
MPPTQTTKNVATPITRELRQDQEAYRSYQAKPQGMAHGYLSSDHVAHWKPNQSTKMREFGRAKVEIAEDLEEKHPVINKPNVRFIKTNDAMRVLMDYAYDGLYRLPIGVQNNFYRCLNPIIEELTDYKNLYDFTYTDDQGVQVLMVDKYGREYKFISPIELVRYNYMDTPILTYYFQPSVSVPGLYGYSNPCLLLSTEWSELATCRLAARPWIKPKSCNLLRFCEAAGIAHFAISTVPHNFLAVPSSKIGVSSISRLQAIQCAQFSI